MRDRGLGAGGLAGAPDTRDRDRPHPGGAARHRRDRRGASRPGHLRRQRRTNRVLLALPRSRAAPSERRPRRSPVRARDRAGGRHPPPRSRRVAASLRPHAEQRERARSRGSSRRHRSRPQPFPPRRRRRERCDARARHVQRADAARSAHRRASSVQAPRATHLGGARGARARTRRRPHRRHACLAFPTSWIAGSMGGRSA